MDSVLASFGSKPIRHFWGHNSFQAKLVISFNRVVFASKTYSLLPLSLVPFDKMLVLRFWYFSGGPRIFRNGGRRVYSLHTKCNPSNWRKKLLRKLYTAAAAGKFVKMLRVRSIRCLWKKVGLCVFFCFIDFDPCLAWSMGHFDKWFHYFILPTFAMKYDRIAHCAIAKKYFFFIFAIFHWLIFPIPLCRQAQRSIDIELRPKKSLRSDYF